MTAIVWDAPTSRQYSSGLDRGVLYTSPDSDTSYSYGQPWSGLISVTDNNSSAGLEEYFWDGQKTSSRMVPSPFAGVLEAYESPFDLTGFNGVRSIKPGFFVDGQIANGTFGLSYRTMLGGALDSTLGYKIHLYYGLNATPADRTDKTQTADPEAETRSWNLTGVPISQPPFKPSCHYILDSRYLDPVKLATVETLLYGDADDTPVLPSPATLTATL